ncbi:MAG TPA: InlB B-repeat-containing protein [candidate division Zixibacteria bacterium]|nr:InlB B-repeat-containing protein [candidate division Zixibacteria bacterium]
MKRTILWTLGFLALTILGAAGAASAAQLRLTWSDNSTDESGFYIERRPGSGSTYTQIASVGADVTSYTDSNLPNSTTYCYRVRAYNSAGTSGYSNESCATTVAATFVVSVSRSGTGSGTVTSSPAGIACGSDCSEAYTSGTTVTLTPVASAGSVFAGWSGAADCSDGVVTANADIACTAVFNAVVASYTLTASVVNQVTSAGSSSGRVVSSPAGIDCGADCTESYTSGTVVVLTPVAGSNSKFTGWTGDADCADGSVTLNGNKSCTANFALNTVTLSVARNGSGTVTSTPAGIDCGGSCSYAFVSGSAVTLRASAATGFVFAGWSGGGCTGTADCTITLTANTTVTANFADDRTDKIGLYRPATGEWFLDTNGNGVWDGCGVDTCLSSFNVKGAVPVVGDWDGSGVTRVGLFLTDLSGLSDSTTTSSLTTASWWRLDTNGNGIWDGCGVDTCINSFGGPTDLPVVGKWSATRRDAIGIFRPSRERWYLDLNGNGILDGCTSDACSRFSSYAAGDLPVAGDWLGSGKTQLGFYRPATGQWFLDRNENRTWNGCGKDTCISSFGSPGDIPVTGDWNGTGIARIGVFRPSTGEWLLDRNGNGVWDGCSLDLCISGFGSSGDIPVVGKW